MNDEDFHSDIHKIENNRRIFLILVAALSAVGLVMVLSASYIVGIDVYGSASYLFFKQMSFVAIGAAIAFVVSKTRFDFWCKNAEVIHGILLALVALTFIPGMGSEVKGASRWISISSFNMQPGEMVKFSLILLGYKYFRDFEKYETKEKLWRGLFLLSPVFLILLQPDFGTFFIGIMVLLFVCFLSSFERKKFYTILGTGLIALVTIVFLEPYRIKRILSFLDPWKNPKTSGFQIIQSYLAFANGSLFGTGLGNSNEKLYYLPEAHNDFIFAVVGEEVGFVGVFLVVALFVSLLIFGMRLAMLLRDESRMTVVSGVTFTLTLQAALNMGVVLGLLPTKGLNLPFISAGGSSLLANFFALGILLSAVRSRLKIMKATDPFMRPRSHFSESPQGHHRSGI